MKNTAPRVGVAGGAGGRRARPPRRAQGLRPEQSKGKERPAASLQRAHNLTDMILFSEWDLVDVGIDTTPNLFHLTTYGETYKEVAVIDELECLRG